MADPTLALAEQVQLALAKHGAECAVIGAWAMLAHGHARPTADLDLGAAVPLDTLRALEGDLAATGLNVELREPDPQDPLGGVLDVEKPGVDLVQVVNYLNSTNALGSPGEKAAREAIATARPVLEGSPLKVVDLPHLVALKLLSWDGVSPEAKPVADVRALLAANPATSLDGLAEVCARLGFGREFARLRSLLA